jgi:ribosomal protein S18 acetylase RimI-like enzyme
MQFEFIRATQPDKEYLLELRKLTMIKHFERAGQFLSHEEHAKRLNDQYECSYLVFYKSNRIGHVKYQLSVHELELIQIQIEPKFQGKGYGSNIVQKILDTAKGKIVKLSVLKGNVAIELYKRLGFKTVGEDKYEYHMQKEH